MYQEHVLLGRCLTVPETGDTCFICGVLLQIHHTHFWANTGSFTCSDATIQIKLLPSKLPQKTFWSEQCFCCASVIWLGRVSGMISIPNQGYLGYQISIQLWSMGSLKSLVLSQDPYASSLLSIALGIPTFHSASLTVTRRRASYVSTSTMYARPPRRLIRYSFEQNLLHTNFAARFSEPSVS